MLEHWKNKMDRGKANRFSHKVQDTAAIYQAYRTISFANSKVTGLSFAEKEAAILNNINVPKSPFLFPSFHIF